MSAPLRGLRAPAPAALLCALLALARTGAAAAGDAATAATMSRAELRLGVLDEDAGAFASAVRHYRACAAAAPASQAARVARARVTWLEQHGEGDFVPLAALERVRRDPARAADPAAIDRLGTEAESFPPGLVRSTARLLVAEAWLKRPDRRQAAFGVLRKMVADPTSGRQDARLAEHDLVTALLADNQLDAARAEARAHLNDQRLVAEVDKRVWQRTLRRAAYLALAAVVATSLVGLLARRRRRHTAWHRSAV